MNDNTGYSIWNSSFPMFNAICLIYPKKNPDLKRTADLQLSENVIIKGYSSFLLQHFILTVYFIAACLSITVQFDINCKLFLDNKFFHSMLSY